MCVVCVREAAGGEGVPEKEPGIQNQKQEPHTKLWGKNPVVAFWAQAPWGEVGEVGDVACGTREVTRATNGLPSLTSPSFLAKVVYEFIKGLWGLW